MLIIGEKINVITKKVRSAMDARDKGPIHEMARVQVSGGADMLDINLGPAKKKGAEIMTWMVETVQEATDVPVSLDTMNVEAMEAGLKVCKKQAMINSVSGQKERMDVMLPLAKENDSLLIGLCLTEDGVPRDANERVETAYNIMMACDEAGIPKENLYIDLLMLPICVAQDQVHALLDAMAMLQELPEPPKTVLGLSNISNNCPPEVQPVLNRAFMAAMMCYGLDAVIMDPNDEGLMAVARGNEEAEYAKIALGLTEGELDMSDPNQLAVHKTIKLFKEETLYCHSWLEL